MTNSMALKSSLAAALLLILSAIPAPAQQLAGKGEWHSLSSAIINGKWTASLVRTGNHVAGTLKLGGSNVFSGGAVSGDIDASSILLGVMANDGVMTNDVREATFTGKLDGDSIKGEWSCPAINDHGVWFGTLAPAVAAAQ